LSYCLECGTKLAEDDDGEIFCPKCGLVDSYMPTRGPTWRSFGTLDDNNISAAPLDRYGHGASTEISFQHPFGSSEEANRWLRLRRTDSEKRSGDNTIDRNIYKANIIMSRLKSMIKIPNLVSETAMDMYSRAAHGNYLRGKTIYGALCAVIYASYRVHAIPISLRGFSNKVGLDKTIIGSNYCHLRKSGFASKDDSNRVYSLISKIVKARNLPGEAEVLSKKIFSILEENKEIVGKSPSSVACSILYMTNIIMGLGIIQKDISSDCNVTEVSLRNNTSKFRKTLMITIEV
jgi:transcription initiation factor TFIIIB Brf1 subunit/transcription initiation factor TFIIB